MTSFAIIAENPEKVNLNTSNSGAFEPLLGINTSSVTAFYCEVFNPDPYATNNWTALRMSFQWHGDDVASFDDEIYALVERNAKDATFRHIDQPASRVVMCNDLLNSIIQRTTYNLSTHNGEISFANGRVHTGMPARFTFRAVTVDGKRVVQEKRGKKKWKLFGPISPDGTVTPIIPSYLPEVAADNDSRYAEAAANAKKEMRTIQAKADLLNNPAEMMDKGVAVSFKGSCRCCNRTLKNPKSVANGIGPTCARLESRAAVSMPTVQAVTETVAPLATTEPHVATIQELQDFDIDLDQPLPLTAEEILFCTSQLGAMGCSDAEIEQFFDDLLPSAPYWYPNFIEEAAEHQKSLDFLYDVCDAFVYSITPVDDYVRIAGQLFRYKRDGSGYEFFSCMGSVGGEIVELVAYPAEVLQVKQQLVWAS